MVPEVYRTLLDRKEVHLLKRVSEGGKPEIGWVFPSSSACGHFDENSAKNQHLAALRTLKALHTARKEQEAPELVAKKAGVTVEFARKHADFIKAGVKAFPPYTIRHTALTRLAAAGCDSFTLAKIAGHSSITITARYCHPQAEAIERAFAKLPETALSSVPHPQGLEMICRHCGVVIGERIVDGRSYSYVHDPDAGQNAYVWCRTGQATQAEPNESNRTPGTTHES